MAPGVTLKRRTGLCLLTPALTLAVVLMLYPWKKNSPPPLVRAVKIGDVSLVRLLLRSGADANVGYHDLHASLILKRIKFGCGRVIQ